MALQVELSLFADKGLREQGSGKTSLIGIFSIATNAFPVIPTMAMYCRLKGEPGPHRVRLVVTHRGEAGQAELTADVEGEVEPTAELEVDVTLPEQGLGEILFNMVGLPIAGNRIEFAIYEKDMLIHTNVIHIEARE